MDGFNDRRPRIRWFYILSILVISSGGIPKGYDEGGYSASVKLPSFELDFGLVASEWSKDPTGLANRSGNILSFSTLGAIFGALFASDLNDRYGRLRLWRGAWLFWASGAIMQVFASGDYGFLLFARIWTGIGAGALTVVAPVFLAEIAGTKARGLVVSCYMANVLLWFTLGYFINDAAGLTLPDDQRVQYRVVQATPFIPSGLAFLGTFAISESPAWLASKDRIAEAQQVLSKLRGLPVDSPQIEHEASLLSHGQRSNPVNFNSDMLQVIKETFTDRILRKRLLLAWLMQTIAQWSGGQGISFYIPQIFRYAGLDSASSDLISSGVYGIVKTVVTLLFAVALIDIIGRRPCMLTGLFLQMCAHIYLAVFTGLKPTNNPAASHAAIAAVFIYAFGWSIGLCTIEFIFASEIFTTRHRGFAYATATCLHWVCQFALVKAVAVMFVALDVWGVFAFFAAVCAAGIVLLGLAVPETKRVPNACMEVLFSGKWYLGFKARVPAGFVEEYGDVEIVASLEEKKEAQSERVEYAAPGRQD